jgi:hypothetical protein
MADLLYKMPEPFEPLRVNRFLVNFPEEMKIPTWMIKTIHLPKLTQKPVFKTSPYIEVKTFNSETFFCIDVVSPYLNKKFELIVEYLTPVGTPIYKIRFKGCHFISVYNSELSYDSTDFLYTYLVIEYDSYEIL